jgi:hypothetical protein
MKVFAVLAALVAACIGAIPAGAALPPAPRPIQVELVQPTAVPVPASVVAAHPDGHPAAVDAVAALKLPGISVTPNAAERVNCWRAFFTQDNSGVWGTEQEWINPYWCGNGSAMRGLDSGWHGQSCNWFVTCAGEGGIGTWYGCANGCSSVGQQITGHFRVDYILSQATVDLTVVYQLYPNGNYWAYGYKN